MHEHLTRFESDCYLVNLEATDTPPPYEIAARALADQFRDASIQRNYLDTFEQFLIGTHGQNLWPEREINGETLRYTVPVFAGFSDDSTLLTILKDPWRSHTEGRDWLVGQMDLPSGRYTEYLVTAVATDASNTIKLQITDPTWYNNMPPLMRPGPTQPLSEWNRITLELDENYLADSAEIRWGIDGGMRQFYDIVHLHAALAGDVQPSIATYASSVDQPLETLVLQEVA